MNFADEISDLLRGAVRGGVLWGNASHDEHACKPLTSRSKDGAPAQLGLAALLAMTSDTCVRRKRLTSRTWTVPARRKIGSPVAAQAIRTGKSLTPVRLHVAGPSAFGVPRTRRYFAKSQRCLGADL